MSISVLVGHATDHINQTGCTVVLFAEAVRCVVDVRGGAPGTRETDLLQPGRLVQQVDALFLTGGSAFGLGAANGVVRYLREKGRGFLTAAGPVPIVPGAVIFDLLVGNAVAPDDEMGYQACQNTVGIDRARWGLIGAGRGATHGNVTGDGVPGGIGMAKQSLPGGSVTAIAVVNALGVADPRIGYLEREALRVSMLSNQGQAGENTTLVVLTIDAPYSQDALRQAAISAHDGMARAITPCHTPFDGDLVFAACTSKASMVREADLALCVATELAVEHAISNAVAIP